ncbi:MAG: sialate O-acetylesterase [Muribaculaceae bacterium]
MEKKSIRRMCIAPALLAVSLVAGAKVELPQFVTDSMVVQQQSNLKIEGKASRNVKVTTSWNGKTTVAPTDAEGRFAVTIATPKAGGPHKITFDDGERLTLRDIYSGEVWLCSGQSNMEMPVGGWGKVMNYEQEIADAKYDNIRFLQVQKQIGFKPADDTNINMGGWRTCSPATVENFSSIAYFYAREMSKKLGVHVGVIDCTWGGTPAEAWTSFEGVKSVPGFEKETQLLTEGNFDIAAMKVLYEKQIEEWMKIASSGSKKFDAASYDASLPTMALPCEWEKSSLPDFDGIVWFQHTIDIPADWAGKAVELHLGMIDDEDVTYFNGTKIAEGSGYNVKRVYTIPAELVKAGLSVISVRVSDFGGGGGIWGDAADMEAVQGGKRISLADEWRYSVAADFSKLPRRPVSVESSSFPCVLYNAMLYPLHVMPVKGVLWYQGCANVGRDAQYSVLFKRLINDWRVLWGNEQMPFYFVQLAGYLQPQLIQPDSQWAALRQAQADALELDNTAMAVAIDIGNPDDIHPKNKQEVARRLSLIALNRTYGCGDVIYEAPKPVSLGAAGNDALVKFDNEVKADGSAPKGFIALVEGKWVRAEAKIVDHNVVRLTADGKIEQVKYDWADYPDGNLRGITGLPVAPFKMGK